MSTVTVACKLPHGLFLRLFKMVEYSEPVMGGGSKIVPRAEQIGGAVTIHGYAAPFGKPPVAQVVGGYALTPNVDADFFAEWLKQNADHDVVKNNLIFANEKPESVHGKAKGRESIRNGLEPIDPNKLPKGIESAKAAA